MVASSHCLPIRRSDDPTRFEPAEACAPHHIDAEGLDEPDRKALR